MIRYQMYRCINKIAKLIDVSILYQTSKGIKSINQLIQSYSPSQIDEFFVESQDLFLGFDALKDQHTLVGVCINKSPHYNLMETLDLKQNVRKTKYCKRYEAGTLDSRSPVFISADMIERFEKIFEKRKKEVAEDSYAPVQVYRINDRLYIADGKHRAAMSAYLGIKIKCVEISDDFLKDSFRQWVYRKMCKKRTQYSCNISLFEKIGK